jgi:hypothetical protein
MATLATWTGLHRSVVTIADAGYFDTDTGVGVAVVAGLITIGLV